MKCNALLTCAVLRHAMTLEQKLRYSTNNSARQISIHFFLFSQQNKMYHHNNLKKVCCELRGNAIMLLPWYILRNE